jgi:hypothetical protein
VGRVESSHRKPYTALAFTRSSQNHFSPYDSLGSSVHRYYRLFKSDTRIHTYRMHTRPVCSVVIDATPKARAQLGQAQLGRPHGPALLPLHLAPRRCECPERERGSRLAVWRPRQARTTEWLLSSSFHLRRRRRTRPPGSRCACVRRIACEHDTCNMHMTCTC